MANASAHIPEDSDLWGKIKAKAKTEHDGKISAYVRAVLERDLSGKGVTPDALSPTIMVDLTKALCGDLVSKGLLAALGERDQRIELGHLLATWRPRRQKTTAGELFYNHAQQIAYGYGGCTPETTAKTLSTLMALGGTAMVEARSQFAKECITEAMEVIAKFIKQQGGVTKTDITHGLLPKLNHALGADRLSSEDGDEDTGHTSSTPAPTRPKTPSGTDSFAVELTPGEQSAAGHLTPPE